MNSVHNYQYYFLTNSGKRVYVQTDEHKYLGRQILQIVRKNWKKPNYFFHLRGGGHVAALSVHSDNLWKAKIDLKSFFNNVTRNKIIKSLKKNGLGYNQSEEIAIVSTVKYEHASNKFILPFGFVQSPILASLVLNQSAIGKRLSQLHHEGMTVSVYMDDIIISGSLYELVQTSMKEIICAAKDSNFPVNVEKTEGPLETIRAFNIESSYQYMAIESHRFEEMQSSIFFHKNLQVTNGILSYVESINPNQANTIRKNFPSLFPRDVDLQ